MAVLVKVAPAHKFLYILYLDIVGLQGFYISEKMLGQRAAVGITRLATLGTAEIRTFQRSPQHHVGLWIFCLLRGEVGHHRPQLQRAYILGEVKRIGMVGLMRQDGVLVVVDARYHFGAFLTVHPGIFHAARRAAGAAEQVNIK